MVSVYIREMFFWGALINYLSIRSDERIIWAGVVMVLAWSLVFMVSILCKNKLLYRHTQNQAESIPERGVHGGR